MTMFSVYEKSNGVLIGPAMPGADGAVLLNQSQSKAWSELKKLGRAARLDGDRVVEYMGWDGPAGERFRMQRDNVLYKDIDNMIKKCVDAEARGAAGASELLLEWRNYREAVRDIPENFPDAGSVIWPAEPKRPDF